MEHAKTAPWQWTSLCNSYALLGDLLGVSISVECDFVLLGFSVAFILSRHTRHLATGNLLSQGQASGTACLLPFEIHNCPVKDLGNCQRLICLDDDRGASAFELAPENCTCLLSSKATSVQTCMIGLDFFYGTLVHLFGSLNAPRDIKNDSHLSYTGCGILNHPLTTQPRLTDIDTADSSHHFLGLCAIWPS